MTSGSSSIGSSRVLPVLHDCRRALKVWHGVGWFVVGCRVLGGRMAGWGPVPREVHKLSEALCTLVCTHLCRLQWWATGLQTLFFRHDDHHDFILQT